MAYAINLDKYILKRDKPISIGRNHENMVRRLQYDLTEVIDTVGSGSFVYIYKRPDGEIYQIPEEQTAQEGSMAVWELTDTDMGYDGLGACQLIYTVEIEETGELDIWKSDIYPLYIHKSLDATTDIPSGWETWYEKFLEIKAEIENAVSHAPIIDDDTNHWMVYDQEEEEYEDTGVNATGPQGEKGDPLYIERVQYAVSNSSTVIPVIWSDTVPEISAGEYLWTRWTYEDGTVVYSVARQGVGTIVSVNGKIGVVVLKTSDLQNDSDYKSGTEIETILTNKNYQNGSQVAAAIQVETDARVLADSGLQNQIDALTSKTDVVDVVGTKAALLAYDTTTLHDKDIVKVLVDESQNNSISYYRWVLASTSWSYVGSQGPFYTKSESDNNLNNHNTNVQAHPDIRSLVSGLIPISELEENDPDADDYTVFDTGNGSYKVKIKDITSYQLSNTLIWNTELRLGSITPNVTLPAPTGSKSEEIIYIFIAATANATFIAPAGYILGDDDGFAGLTAGNTISKTDLTVGSIYECSFSVLDSTHIGLIMKEWTVA